MPRTPASIIFAACATALALAGCGGGGGHHPGTAAASAKAVAACARTAGFVVTAETFDPTAHETAQLGLQTPASVSPANPITLGFYSDSASASALYQAQGGAQIQGPEPGGNDLMGTVVVSYYARDAWLRKAEHCVR